MGEEPVATWGVHPGARTDPLARAQAALAGVPLFGELSKRQVRALARSGRVVTRWAGATIVEQGGPGDSLYVLLEGSARVERGGRCVATLAEGDFFGEVSILDGGPRSASVIAATQVRLLKLEGREVRRLIDAEPKLALRMLAVMAARVRSSEAPPAG